MALRIRAGALTKRIALTQASEQETKANFHAVLAALEAERTTRQHFKLLVSQHQASGDDARLTIKNVCRNSTATCSWTLSVSWQRAVPS
jgi:hypothetical protein